MLSLTPDQALALARLRRRQMAEARRIIRTVATEYGVTVEQLRGTSRVRPVNEARQVCMYLMRTDLRWPESDRDIPFQSTRAAILMKRDHSTVLHGADVIARRLGTDRYLAYMIDDIRAALRREDDHSRGGHHGTATHHSRRPDRAVAGQYAPV